MSEKQSRILASLVLWTVLSATAYADLQVNPTRIHLSDTVKVAKLALRHLGDKPRTYRITSSFYRMKADGTLDEVKDPKADERPLGKYLRFSPREIKLAPQVEQVVRVMYSGPGNLPEGEYRTHLNIEPADAADAGTAPESPKADKRIRMQLEARVGFAIPVIFRRGNPSYSVTLNNLRVLKNPEGAGSAAVDVTWTGTAFPFGEFHALVGKDAQDAGVIRGIAAYTSPRTVTVPLNLASDKLAGNKLRVEFREPEENGGKVLQSVEAAIP